MDTDLGVGQIFGRISLYTELTFLIIEVLKCSTNLSQTFNVYVRAGTPCWQWNRNILNHADNTN